MIGDETFYSAARSAAVRRTPRRQQDAEQQPAAAAASEQLMMSYKPAPLQGQSARLDPDQSMQLGHSRCSASILLRCACMPRSRGAK